MKLPEILAQVALQVGAVRKAETNAAQGFKFRGIDAVVNAAGPALHKAGVIVYPELQNVEYSIFETRNGGRATSCRVIVSYNFAHLDERIKVTVAAESMDSGDKSTAKAMSVAFRTALLQALTLPTDDPDPDSETYEIAAETKPAADPWTTPAAPAQVTDPGKATGKQLGLLAKLLRDRGITKPEDGRQFLADLTGESTPPAEMTKAQISGVIEALQAMAAN
jgi:hypothetical protein